MPSSMLVYAMNVLSSMLMKFTINILFLFVTWCSFSQHTDRFKKFTESIKPVDSIIIDTKFRNGNLKETGLIKIYEHGDYDYEFFSGKQTSYYKSGEVKSIEEFDSFGNLINSQLYDYKGFPYCSKEIMKIDTQAKSLDDFFESDKDLLVTMYFKKYRLSLIPGDWFLLEEGKIANGEMVGEWKKYNKDGSIKEVTNH